MHLLTWVGFGLIGDVPNTLYTLKSTLKSTKRIIGVLLV
jgi:hypothetical protein